MNYASLGLVAVLALGSSCGGDPTPLTPDAAPDASSLTTVTVTLDGFPTGAGAETLKYAYQDEGGVWKEAPPPVGGVLTIAVAGPRYAVAEYCRTDVAGDFDTRAVTLSYRNLADGIRWTATVDRQCRSVSKFAGVLSGAIQSIERARHDINFAGRRVSATTSVGATTTTYAMAVDPSTSVLFGRRTKLADGQVDAMILERAFSAKLTTVKNLDFNANGFAPAKVPVATGSTGARVFYYLGGVLAGNDPGSATPTDFPVLPVDKRLPGDTYLFEQSFTVAAANADVVYSKMVATPAPISNPTIAPLSLEARAEGHGYSLMLPSAPPAGTSLSIFELSSCPDRDLCTISYLVNDPERLNGGQVRWAVPSLVELPGWSTTALQTSSTEGWLATTQSIGTIPAAGYESTFVEYKFGVSPAASAIMSRRQAVREQAARRQQLRDVVAP